MNTANTAAAEFARLQHQMATLEDRRAALTTEADSLEAQGHVGAFERVLRGGLDKAHAARRAKIAGLRAQVADLDEAMADGRSRLIEAEQAARDEAQANRLSEAKAEAAKASKLQGDIVGAARDLAELIRQHKAACEAAASLTGRATVELASEALGAAVLRALWQASGLSWASAGTVAERLTVADHDLGAAGRDALAAVAAMTINDTAEAA